MSLQDGYKVPNDCQKASLPLGGQYYSGVGDACQAKASSNTVQSELRARLAVLNTRKAKLDHQITIVRELLSVLED